MCLTTQLYVYTGIIYNLIISIYFYIDIYIYIKDIYQYTRYLPCLGSVVKCNQAHLVPEAENSIEMRTEKGKHRTFHVWPHYHV